MSSVVHSKQVENSTTAIEVWYAPLVLVATKMNVFTLGKEYCGTKLQCSNCLINAVLLYGIIGIVTGFLLPSEKGNHHQRAVKAILLMSSFFAILGFIWLKLCSGLVAGVNSSGNAKV